MAEKKNRNKWSAKLRNRYRLIFYNDTTLQSEWTFKLTPVKLFTVVSLSLAFMIFLVVFLVASTPLREYIPGYPREEYREMLLKNVLLVDSLENELALRDRFFSDFRAVVSGDIPDSRSTTEESAGEPEAAGKTGRREYKPINADSVFQDKILEERLNLSANNLRETGDSPEKIHFYLPVKGLIIDKFDARKEHYGVDLVGQPNSRISAVLGGTVLFSGWTLETGNVIYIQHENNLTSAYKHNAELLKRTGETVKAGEAIAIIGNSGELSTGPHLHFELWVNGKPVDPEKYIVF